MFMMQIMQFKADLTGTAMMAALLSIPTLARCALVWWCFGHAEGQLCVGVRVSCWNIAATEITSGLQWQCL
jgi:hypothetical protein